MWGLTGIDWVVLAVYLIGITVLGVWTSRTVKSLGDFLMPRRYGKGFMLMYAFGAGTNSDVAVVVAAKIFSIGISGLWYTWCYLFATPFYWVISPILRRTRAYTMADVYRMRFDGSLEALYALSSTLKMSLAIGLMLLATGKVVEGLSGGQIPSGWTILVVAGLFVIYGVMGGLAAAVVTDFVQGLMIIVFSFLLLPMVLRAVGGMSGVVEKIQDPAMLDLFSWHEITIFWIIMVSLNNLIGWVSNPVSLVTSGPSKNEFDTRFGVMGGNLIKRVCSGAWALTGLAAVVYFAGQEIEPDMVWGRLASELLPAIGPGAVGLFTACMLAGIMSTCDSMMITGSGLFTENLYKKRVVGRSESHYVLVGRIASFFVVVMGLAFAFSMSGVIEALEVVWQVSAMMGITFWLGFFWRGTTVAGAWASALLAFGAFLMTEASWFVAWLATLPFSESVLIEGGEGPVMFLPWKILFYLLVGTLGGIVVSLFTRPVDPVQLERFYELIRTPVREGEIVRIPCTLPLEVEPQPRRNLIKSSSIELMVPTRQTVVGFIVGWVIVGALIAGFNWLIPNPVIP